MRDGSARRRLSELHSDFLFCLSEMGAWLAFKVNFVPCWFQNKQNKRFGLDHFPNMTSF